MQDYTNQIVWITGASSGIGEACALAFIEAGATVIGLAPNLQELELSRSKSAHPERFHLAVLDLLDSDSIAPLATSLLAQYGRVDILMNNAGVSQRSLVADTPIANDRRVMEINYFGAVILTKAILPHMLRQGGGHLLCTSSLVGVFGFPLRSAYSAAKHALHGFFESLRTEYHDQNIRVSIIIGGRIQTNISLHALLPDGRSYGQMDDGQKNGISREKAAQQILRGIRKNQSEIWVGGKERWMILIHRWFPSLSFYISRKIKST